jgi:hypothetical protein
MVARRFVAGGFVDQCDALSVNERSNGPQSP